MAKYTNLPLSERKDVIMPETSDTIFTKYKNKTAQSLLTAKAKIATWWVTRLSLCDHKYKYPCFPPGGESRKSFILLHPSVGDAKSRKEPGLQQRLCRRPDSFSIQPFITLTLVKSEDTIFFLSYEIIVTGTSSKWPKLTRNYKTQENRRNGLFRPTFLKLLHLIVPNVREKLNSTLWDWEGEDRSHPTPRPGQGEIYFF